MSEQTSTLEHLDAIPQVAFDIKLGEYVSYIDFDYEAYDEFLRDAGVDQTEIENLEVYYRRPRFYHSLHLGPVAVNIRGYHRREDKIENKSRIGVVLGPGRDQKGVNTTTTHETQHFIQHAVEGVDKKDKRLYKLRLSGMLGGVATAVWGSTTASLGAATGSEGLLMTGGGAVALGLVTAGGSYASYVKHPREIDARESGSASTQFVTLCMKDAQANTSS